ncbi:Uncharacterized protein YrbK clustered with lipopolysaccharide transporters (plasmid) [Legionella adelaidensis]|uniref:Lipopolysaccharide export system protein LptC n=1 Tax=Legionella adelaidensis TaxID=45056 RepID=A0A0W0R3S0_9GAMM|nr:LPS export ABC transporter periplasmic protein LptC [Legionella adelaidensis]KTC65727.1 lipopolysaccharide export system protein LptC [Legionella adelaidensis]VEH85107.1 Uncharacterized protein YrbK clustered with lipopolysaccharide transporters [Legionella adelaidensis]
MNAGSKQAVWIFIALIALACSGWYFASSPIQITLDNQTLANTIDSTATHLTVKQFNAEGKLASLLQTPQMDHIPNENTHLLAAPFIKINQINKPAWEVQSKQAISKEGGQLITFEKDVIIHQKSAEQTAESTLKTELLFYQPKTKLAWTHAKVFFEQMGNIVESKGMKAYLEEKHIQLLSEARATYVPKQG